MLARSVITILTRDLEALRREIADYPDDAAVWRLAPGIQNSAGTLALHLTGNLQHFFGATLGGTPYVRDRDAEFASRDVPRAKLVAQIDGTIRALATVLPRLTDQVLAADYPLPVGGHTMNTGDFLLHLATHFTYHLGQLDYHRRMVTGQVGKIGAVAPAGLASARPVPS